MKIEFEVDEHKMLEYVNWYEKEYRKAYRQHLKDSGIFASSKADLDMLSKTAPVELSQIEAILLDDMLETVRADIAKKYPPAQSYRINQRRA